MNLQRNDFHRKEIWDVVTLENRLVFLVFLSYFDTDFMAFGFFFLSVFNVLLYEEVELCWAALKICSR